MWAQPSVTSASGAIWAKAAIHRTGCWNALSHQLRQQLIFGRTDIRMVELGIAPAKIIELARSTLALWQCVPGLTTSQQKQRQLLLVGGPHVLQPSLLIGPVNNARSSDASNTQLYIQNYNRDSISYSPRIFLAILIFIILMLFGIYFLYIMLILGLLSKDIFLSRIFSDKWKRELQSSKLSKISSIKICYRNILGWPPPLKII